MRTKYITMGILAHVDAGKTTLSEAVLYLAGAIRKIGRVDHKNAFLDTDEIERERGITVFSKEARFETGGKEFTLLDTPGHTDFSSETERTLQVLDYAVLVVSGADGVQAHTVTLWKLFRHYGIPVFVFVNKMDRPCAERQDIIRELSEQLGGGVFADFGGRNAEEIAGASEVLMEEYLETGTFCEESIRLAIEKRELFPVFFGSALSIFGVEPFLEEFLRMTPSPLPREADCGVIDTFSPDFSAFVFKIQANMNKAHRDRLAFMRICSGQFQRDAEYYHVQTGKKMRLSQPQQLMASEREIVDEAYAGDIIGVFDPGIFSIGDTITVPGKKFKFGGIPTFAPEHFARVSAKDSMKRKQFLKGTEQIAQEGAIQIFKVPNSGMEEVIVGVVGTLQFDVFQYRMKAEYGVDLRMQQLPYEQLRFITKAPVADLKDLYLSTDAELLEDYHGRSLLVFASQWSINFILKRNPGLELAETAQ